MNNRKISPHVTIYKFPLPALSSISNRITGVAMTGLFLGYGIGNLIEPNFNNLTNDKFKELSYPLKFGIANVFVLPVTYHTVGGLRHFYLDKFPKNLNNSFMNKSSLGMFVSSLIISGITSHFISK